VSDTKATFIRKMIKKVTKAKEHTSKIRIKVKCALHYLCLPVAVPAVP